MIIFLFNSELLGKAFNNLSSFNVHENLDKKIIINNLANKINLLVEENNKIKKQFDKYKY